MPAGTWEVGSLFEIVCLTAATREVILVLEDTAANAHVDGISQLRHQSQVVAGHPRTPRSLLSPLTPALQLQHVPLLRPICQTGHCWYRWSRVAAASASVNGRTWL